MASSMKTSSDGLDIKKIAIIGCGSMGGGMALLFAEHGIQVSLQDPDSQSMDGAIEAARKDGLQNRISKHANYKSLCDSLGEPKVFVLSLPHGTVGDTVLNNFMPYLKKGDIIIDCGNERWENTERRQGKCVTKGIRYVGCGVSGGYQAARRGPSMCPGADDETLSLVLPLLQKVAAKAPDGSPCVGRIGTGGAGHYCKMIHNGIEHGMMAAISEAWAIMTRALGMSLDEVADELQRWHDSGELKNTFLIGIGADICRKQNYKGEKVLPEVLDKVVQDWTGEEGTGVWSNDEAIYLHVPAPTLSTAHYLRIASGDLQQRRKIFSVFGAPHPPQRIKSDIRKNMLEDLRLAVFGVCLAAYAQGLNVIDAANKAYHFNVDYAQLLQIWRAGCIIRADYINDSLLMPIYRNRGTEYLNPLYDANVAKELGRSYTSLKKILLAATEQDQVVPSLSSTLEYLKYMTNTNLPTVFYEAELDYFGSHMYDKKGEDEEGKPETGRYHFEWKPA